MYNDIQQYVQTCMQCQKAKPDAHKRPTPLQPLPVLDVFRRVHMDILGPFRKSSGDYTHVLLIVDSFTKFMEILPMKHTGAKDVADLFYNQWICRYSAPDAILTDKGQNFMSNILKEVCNIFEIQKINTSSYRPQTNSTCERNNKTIAEKLRTCIDANQLNWPEKLPSIAHAMNTSVCTESTQYTPYFLVFGRECRTPIDTVLTEPSKVGPVAKQLKKFYDPQDRPTNNVDVPTDDEMSDDDDNEEVENAEDDDEIGQTDTQPDSNDPTQNNTQVQRHTNDDRKNDDSDLYLVERIVKAKRINNKMHYYIKWLGYSHRHNTHEPEENIPPELRHEFKVRMDQAKRIKARKTKR
ncbi:Hypothetical predicted protein [Mytilus galloprovincialis]|uniref:Integrase catalytic domain-containing protein n=1 Tax=Mytilus galloprovincialis TaxID=29158 RepID=A0A8B6D8B5_MYTGA|nr:Hypothetical predicted protein [Mytilus galloprovincialis]